MKIEIEINAPCYYVGQDVIVAKHRGFISDVRIIIDAVYNPVLETPRFTRNNTHYQYQFCWRMTSGEYSWMWFIESEIKSIDDKEL